ncbi:MAG: hypothetical protein ACE5IL_01205 [Myxococcota bacterium]
MSWQRSIHTAVRALKTEESALEKQLETLRSKIADLEEMARQGGVKSSARRPRRKRQLSSEGRAAISRAAKKRWERYRAEKKRATRRRSS